jgi:hypothetical protein
MLTKACTPNVVGKMYENTFHNPGMAVVGHEVPVRKRHIGDMNRNSTNTDSLFVMRVEKVMLKYTQSVNGGRSNMIVLTFNFE